MAKPNEEQQIQEIRDNAAVAMALKTEAGQIIVGQVADWLEQEVEGLLVDPMPEEVMLERLHRCRGAVSALEPLRDRLRAAYRHAAKRAVQMQRQAQPRQDDE